MNPMNASTATLSHPGLSEATPWAGSPAMDVYQEMLGHEARGWSLLRLVVAAGLTVLALGIIVSLLP